MVVEVDRRVGGLLPAEDWCIYQSSLGRRWRCRVWRGVLGSIVVCHELVRAGARGRRGRVGDEVRGREDAVSLRELRAVHRRLPQGALVGIGRGPGAARLREGFWRRVAVLVAGMGGRRGRAMGRMRRRAGPHRCGG